MRAVRIIAVAVLVFLGLSGIVGAIPLLVHPTGEPWAMPQSLLRHSPFQSYLIPGIILLMANGLLSLRVLWLTVRRHSGYGCWAAAQGCVLRVADCGDGDAEVVWPHYLYGAVALVLVVASLALVQSPPALGTHRSCTSISSPACSNPCSSFSYWSSSPVSARRAGNLHVSHQSSSPDEGDEPEAGAEAIFAIAG
jgi:hypothetical protein